MKTILILFVVTLVDFRAHTKCTSCCREKRPCSNCLSCVSQPKDDTGDMKKSKIASRCEICDVIVCKCIEQTDNLSCIAVGKKPENEEVKIRSKRSIIRVPTIRRGQIFAKGRRQLILQGYL